ncbi:MAG: Rap1a/Tai family immunity protein [Alphaproteobacteria bacterium]
MKKLLIPAAVLATLFSAPAPASATSYTCMDLANRCASKVETDKQFCLAYLTGAIKQLLPVDGVCPFEGVPVEQLQRLYIKWAIENQGRLNEPAGICTLATFTSNFPCGR